MATDRSAQLEQLLTAYRAVLDGLLGATDGLDAAAWDRPTGCPGWDVHDQLAHCVGLERRLLGDDELDPDVVVPDLAHLTGDIGRFLERDVEARRGRPHTEVVEEARETFVRRFGQLAQLTPDELDERRPSLFGPMRTASSLRMRLFDLASHERDIRAAVDRLDGLAGPHVPIVVEYVLRAWARALPSRVDGDATVRVEVDAGPPVALDLATGDLTRGADAGATASATLRLTPAAVLALAGGRSDAPELGSLERHGDEGLLRAVLGAAAVTP